MKKAFSILAFFGLLFAVGCENPELMNCQQENQTLQSNVLLMQQELAATKAAVDKKDKTIEDLRSENVLMQTKAMESIRTMMEKQAAQDQELKEKLTAAQQQNKDLQQQLEKTKAEISQAQQQVQELQQQVQRQPTAPAATEAPTTTP